MGRIIVILLLAVLVVPAFLLWRLWRQTVQRRAVNEATVAFFTPTVEAEQTLARWPFRARLIRGAGLLAGLVLVVVLALRFGTLSVFGWPPALGLGYLLGVLVAETLRPRPAWALAAAGSGPAAGRRTRLGDLIDLSLVRALRICALLGVGAGVTLLLLSEPTATGSTGIPVRCPRGGTEVIGAGSAGVAAVGLLTLSLVGWLLAEAALLRAVRRPAAAESDDVPVDEALRGASAHVAVAAATAFILVPLGASSLVSGVSVVGSCLPSDVLGPALIAGGFAAVLAGLLVAAFLPNWLRPLQRRVDATR